MKSFTKLRLFLILCALAAGFITSAQAHEAKVLKVSGDAQVQLPGQSSSQALTKGMLVPAGSLITTASGGQVQLETLPGVVSTIEAESAVVVEKLSVTKEGNTVTAQEAMLDLKKGNLISTLDPTKKAINNYGVRTPRGVAAARGTVYGITVNVSGTTVATLSGSVSVDLGNGQSVDIPVGSGMMTDAQIVTLNAAIAASGQAGLTLETLLAETVAAVADNVALGADGPLANSDTATAVLAGVVNAASAASPSNAAVYTSTATTALVTSGGSTAAIAAVTEAAAQGATRTLVENAVATARSSGASDAEVAAVAQTASDNAQSTVQAIADSAFAAASAGGAAGGNTQALALAIATSATTGARTAANAAATAANAPAPVSTPIATIATPEGPVAPVDVPTPTAPIVTPETPVDLPPVSGA